MKTDKALRYLRLAADFAANHSKDRSTKVGALFLHPTDFTTLSRGYNGFPRGADDDLPARHERPLKYDYIEHSECNGVFNAVHPLLAGAVVLTTEQLDMGMARALIAVGTKEVWFPITGVKPENQDIALLLLEETGVFVGRHDGQKLLTPDQTRQRVKLASYLADLESLCKHLSKDPYAQATMFLEPVLFSVLTEGYSGMPRGADDTQTQRYTGPDRKFWVENSVRNAIYNRARPLLAGSISIVTEVPCTDCLRAIAAVGASAVVSYAPSEDYASRWSHQVDISRQLMDELGIDRTEIIR